MLDIWQILANPRDYPDWTSAPTPASCAGLHISIGTARSLLNTSLN